MVKTRNKEVTIVRAVIIHWEGPPPPQAAEHQRADHAAAEVS